MTKVKTKQMKKAPTRRTRSKEEFRGKGDGTQTRWKKSHGSKNNKDVNQVEPKESAKKRKKFVIIGDSIMDVQRSTM